MTGWAGGGQTGHRKQHNLITGRLTPRRIESASHLSFSKQFREPMTRIHTTTNFSIFSHVKQTNGETGCGIGPVFWRRTSDTAPIDFCTSPPPGTANAWSNERRRPPLLLEAPERRFGTDRAVLDSGSSRQRTASRTRSGDLDRRQHLCCVP